MPNKNWFHDRVLWIAAAAWVIWFASMLIVASGAGSSSTWIALDAVAKAGTEISLVGHVPGPDGQLARVASSAPGWQLPAAVEVQHGHAHFAAMAPEQTGFHTWSVHPNAGDQAISVSVGSFAVVAAGDPWVGISIDEILADAPWYKIQSPSPPRLYPAAHGGMLDLSRHAVLVCWSSIDTASLPSLREWWSRLALPSSILLVEDEAGSALRIVRQQLGDPLLCLAGVDAIGSLPASEIEVIGVGAGSVGGWQTAIQRVEQLQQKGN